MELFVDINNRLIYSLGDSSYFTYNEPDVIKNERNLSINGYATKFFHIHNTTTIIFDKSIPKYLTGDLLFQNNEDGIKKVNGRDYTWTLLSFSKSRHNNLKEEITSAKKICYRAGNPKNLLFGY